MTEKDLELTREQQAARDVIQGLGEVHADPAFRGRLGREFATGLFSPHRELKPVPRSSAVTFMRWVYVPVAAGLLIFAAQFWNRGPDWEVIGTSPGGSLTVNGEAVSATDQDRLKDLLTPGAQVALSPKTVLTLKARNMLTLQIAPGTEMTLPSRANRWFGRTIRTAVESGEVVFTDKRRPYDLLLGVPPHRPPAVVRESGLVDGTGWVSVNPRTLETQFPGVYAIGDVVQISLANGKPLPKAGVFAEAMGETVADRIVAVFTRQEPEATFKGEGGCYLEVGGGKAMMVRGNFLAEPEPDVSLTEPSGEYLDEKRSFETQRLQTWFG